MILIQTKEKLLSIVLKKTFFKLMINSNYGKTIESLRKILNGRLVNNAKDCKKYVIKPSFVSQKIFEKNFVALHEIKPVLTLYETIYVGFSILDFSKLLIYDFHHNDTKTKHKNCAKLLFTDTNSLVYEIERNDVYDDFYENKNLFDFRDYPNDSKFVDPVNKKVVGKMKDEFKGKIISKFCGLKSKMYSVIDIDNEENKKAKGVSKNVVKK